MQHVQQRYVIGTRSCVAPISVSPVAAIARVCLPLLLFPSELLHPTAKRREFPLRRTSLCDTPFPPPSPPPDSGRKRRAVIGNNPKATKKQVLLSSPASWSPPDLLPLGRIPWALGTYPRPSTNTYDLPPPVVLQTAVVNYNDRNNPAPSPPPFPCLLSLLFLRRDFS